MLYHVLKFSLRSRDNVIKISIFSVFGHLVVQTLAYCALAFILLTGICSRLEYNEYKFFE